MRLQNFLTSALPSSLKFNFEAIASDRELSQQIQVRLKDLGYLDSIADGNFGPISAMALRNFQEAMNCNEPDFLSSVTAKKLIETKVEDIPKPPLFLTDDLSGKIIKYMQSQRYQIFQGERFYNIVYLEGVSPDGKLNKDTPNYFNDLRLILEITAGIPQIIGRWVATTEPGGHYTYNPMNSGGAARIKFGQYQAWQVGIHGNAEPHQALIQVAPVNVYRDFNKDFSRIGDKEVRGTIGLNQHHGYDLSENDIQNASAGCLVGRTREGHKQFMKIVKQDKRYQANSAYVFTTTIIPGDELGV